MATVVSAKSLESFKTQLDQF